VAKNYPGIRADDANIDAICMWMFKNPQDYSVLVAENMFGDIVDIAIIPLPRPKTRIWGAQVPACCIRRLRRMSSFASLMCARNRFAAGCRELQASSLLSPDPPFLFVILPQSPSGISLGVRIGTELNSPARSQRVRKTCAMSRID